MPRELVNPNLHVALIHFPMGLLLAGVLIELFSFMWRRSTFRLAGRWMILLGALSAIPAATSGIYALAEVSRAGMDEVDAAGQWKDVAAASPLWQHAQAAHMMRDHVWQMSISTALAVAACVIWVGCSDRWRAKLHLPVLLLLVIAAGFAVAGAWHAGEAVYVHGVAVETPPAQAVMPPATEPATNSIAPAADAAAQSLENRFAERFPPVQTHAILAGVTVAVALAAMALSIRAISAGPGITQVDQIATALGGAEARTNEPDAAAASVPADLIRVRVPASRFWLLAFLFALLTAGAGYWLMARGYETWDFKTLWEGVISTDQNSGRQVTRRVAHGAAGAAIVVLPLLLAISSRLAPRARFVLLILGLLLIAAVAAQIWLGVLLLFDTNVGPVTRFN